MAKNMTPLQMTADVLLLAGGLNWGFVSFGVNPVDQLGQAIGIPMVATVVYFAVGAAAVVKIFGLGRMLS